MGSVRRKGRRWVAAQAVVLIGALLWPIAVTSVTRWPAATDTPRMAMGGILALLGLVQIGFGAAALGSELTPMPEPKIGATLRTEGVYGLVRHPIYGGIVLALAGYGLAAQSALGLTMPVVVFAFFDCKASFEERLLVDRFSDYPAYRQRTRKLIPWLY